MPRICARNHGSILQAAKIWSSAKPWRIACATLRRRSGVGVPSAARIALRFSASSGPMPSIAISSKPVRPVSSERSAFCMLSWKVRPIAIASPTDFIEVVSVWLGAGEFLEREARDLGDDVVDGRLERRRRRAAGDVVGDLVERVADRELGRDLGDREAGRLRGQRRGARHPRVHLDDDEAAVRRIDRELHVRAAGLDPDLAQHRDRGVAHDLVFLVGERQRRRDGDRVAGVDAHRIEILDRADDDAVVVLVANDLHLEFLPAEHRFLDQHFGGGGGVEPALDDVEKLLACVGDAAAGAGERERGPDDRRQADLLQRLQRLDQSLLDVALLAVGLARQPLRFERRERVALGVLGKAAGLDLLDLGGVLRAVLPLQAGGAGERRLRRLQADLLHRLAEQLAVLGLVDGVGIGADHLHAEFFEHAHAAQRQRGVERGLPAHGRQQRVGPLLLDDLGDDLRRDRLDIGRVGEVRVGHDRRRVRVDQDDPVALLLERLAGLGAGIVEFAGLADDDRTGADDQDRFDVGSLGHEARWYLGILWAQKKGALAARPSGQRR